MKFLLAFFALITCDIALAQEATYMGQEYISDPTLWSRFMSVAPDWLLVGIPFVLAFMIAARGASEALLAIKDKTETNLDNKLYSILNMTSNVLGKGLGYIGVGMPKKMMDEKTKKIEVPHE